MITVFTPTYNRAYILGRLYQSLKQQDCFDFEWLVINDGSTDDTDALFQQWMQEKNAFIIRYYRVANGGKQRAINKALELAKGEYFFIVDSDDLLRSNAISFIKKGFQTLSKSGNFIGISTVKGDLKGNPIRYEPLIDKTKGYIDLNNLQRAQYNLQADMAEVFFTAKLRFYKFPVWSGEKFTPEAVVWDQLALDGYKIRWYNQIIYLCEYQADGLTNSSWNLLKKNPMGYAMLFNTQLKYVSGIKNRINLVLQFLSCCCIAKQYKYICKCNTGFSKYLLFPLGWLLSLRRKLQFKKYCK